MRAVDCHAVGLRRDASTPTGSATVTVMSASAPLPALIHAPGGQAVLVLVNKTGSIDLEMKGRLGQGRVKLIVDVQGNTCRS